jgi:hypothetical protein
MIFKNLVLQARGTIRIRFLQKKYFKKIHACVPLNFFYVLPIFTELVQDLIIKDIWRIHRVIFSVGQAKHLNCIFFFWGSDIL